MNLRGTIVLSYDGSYRGRVCVGVEGWRAFLVFRLAQKLSNNLTGFTGEGTRECDGVRWGMMEYEEVSLNNNAIISWSIIIHS